jgi:rhamnulokinase/L-fuculokinase
MGLWLEQESKRQWEREGQKTTFDELSNAAMASEPMKCFIDPDSPEFTPPGDQPKRIAEFCRRTGQYVPETKGEIIRCIFDSLAMKYRFVVEAIEEVRGTKVPSINIVGGGTKEAPLCQLTANASGKPVYTGPVEATALGNIAAQAIALGEVKDRAEARQIIANSFEIEEYYPEANKEEWDEAYEKFKKLI